jgi:hypothetical protein
MWVIVNISEEDFHETSSETRRDCLSKASGQKISASDNCGGYFVEASPYISGLVY